MAKKSKESKTLPTTRAAPIPRPGSLSNIFRIQQEMGKVYRDARTGRIKPSDGTKLIYILNTMANLIEKGELEKRLDELESRFQSILATGGNHAA